ncbi:MAG: hypothetical protein CVT98_10010 [Bacteroidetes bacterium HGW-Bacteroidetes-15]|nr:MAG: hypothetical protein CVT98_10010 [Bacteroidetes bacterium HGW-Bacteroidetes-15]
MKRFQSLLISSIFVFALAFASCGSTGEKAKEEAKTECNDETKKEHECEKAKKDSCASAKQDTCATAKQDTCKH